MSSVFRLLPLIVLCFFACKKTGITPSPLMPSEPVLYPVGQPTGAAIVKTIGAEGGSIETLDGAKVKPQVHSVSWDPVAAEKGEYRHFMQKEIHEQVRALTDTLAGKREPRSRLLDDVILDRDIDAKVERTARRPLPSVPRGAGSRPLSPALRAR